VSVAVWHRERPHKKSGIPSTHVKLARAAQGRVQPGDNDAQPVMPGQQWLPAMQDDLDGGQAVLGRMLGNTIRSLPDDVIRHAYRTAGPALVGALVDVTVVTCEITAAVHLQHELIERERVPFHRGALAQMAD
jgi:hypothetical protein